MALECRADGCHRAEVVNGYCEGHLAEKLGAIRAGGEVDGVPFARVEREEPEMEVAEPKMRRPNGYWTFGTALQAYSEVAEKIGHAPGWDEMCAHGQSSAVTNRKWKLHELRDAWERQQKEGESSASETGPDPEPVDPEEFEEDPVAEVIGEVMGLIVMLASLSSVKAIELIYEDDATREASPSLFRRLLREELARFDLEDIGEATLRHLDGEGVDLRSVR